MMADKEEYIQLFEKWGTEHLRMLVSSGSLSSHMIGDAAEWLGKRDQEERLRDAASRASQRRTSLRAEIAAWIAAAAAIIAAIAAIITVVLAVK